MADERPDTAQLSVRDPEPDGRAADASFGVALALTSALAAGWFSLLLAVVMLIDPPTRLPGGLGEQNQDAETLLFALAFVVVLPLSVIAALGLARRIGEGPNRAALPSLSGVLAGTVCVAVLAVRASGKIGWGEGVGVVLIASLLWCSLSSALLIAAIRRPLRSLRAISAHTGPIWIAVGALVLLVLLGMSRLGSLSGLALAAGALVAVAGSFAYGRAAPPRIRSSAGISLDLIACALLVLAVPNLVIFQPELASGNLDLAIQTSVIQFHQDFYLGASSQLLGGGAMLVDTVSQYGVGSIYLIAGWFNLAPIGNGTLGLFEGLLSAIVFICGYLVLRFAGVARWLSMAAFAVAVVALTYNLEYPVGALLQHGAHRFGLPMVLLLAGVATVRFPRWSFALWLLQLATVAVSAVWALEGFAYTGLTYAAIACVAVWLAPAGRRAGRAVRAVAGFLVACVAAHVLFAAATLIAAGHLPDWGMYYSYLHAFLFGSLGDLNFDFSTFSPALAVCALYLFSAAAIVLLMLKRPEQARREAPTMIALAGSTGYGIALFSYFVNRSADHILPYVCLPAIMVATLWLGLLLRHPERFGIGVRRGALGFSLAVAALLISVAWPLAGTRFSQTALADIAPGGDSLGGSLSRLWDPPPFDSSAPAGERMVRRHMGSEPHPYMLVSADLGIEIAARLGRANGFPLSDPWEESFVPEPSLPALRDSVDGLRRGDRLLLDERSLAAFKAFRDDPSASIRVGAAASGSGGLSLVPRGLAYVQLWTLRRIARRFDLRVVAKDGQGFAVAELEPRRISA